MSILSPDMSVMDALVTMSKGNPGAATVLAELIKSDEWGFIDVFHLDDAGLYGSNIWIAYKDICGQDIDRLRTAIRDRTIGDQVRASKYYVAT